MVIRPAHSTRAPIKGYDNDQQSTSTLGATKGHCRATKGHCDLSGWVNHHDPSLFYGPSEGHTWQNIKELQRTINSDYFDSSNSRRKTQALRWLFTWCVSNQLGLRWKLRWCQRWVGSSSSSAFLMNESWMRCDMMWHVTVGHNLKKRVLGEELGELAKWFDLCYFESCHDDLICLGMGWNHQRIKEQKRSSEWICVLRRGVLEKTKHLFLLDSHELQFIIQHSLHGLQYGNLLHSYWTWP